MELNETSIQQINSGTIGAGGTSPSSPATNGGDGEAASLTVSSDTYFDPSAPLDLTPYADGGTGGFGTGGNPGTSPAPVGQTVGTIYTLAYPQAGPGGAGGSSGSGGAAELDMDDDQFGSLVDPLGGSMTISTDVSGGNGVYGADGGNGGSAGSDAVYSSLSEQIAAGNGGAGGSGGNGGNGGSATNSIDSLTAVVDASAIIDLIAIGGDGAPAGSAGAGGNGRQAGAGGSGGSGGSTGDATASVTNSNISSEVSVAITLAAQSGFFDHEFGINIYGAGSGGNGAGGGEYINNGTPDVAPNVIDATVGSAGNGGAGGAGGAAFADLINNTLTAPEVSLDFTAFPGANANGGTGGAAVASASFYNPGNQTQYNTYGAAAGTAGAAGVSEAGTITFTGNTISASGTLVLALSAPNSATPLNSTPYWELTFSGNSFNGGGSSTLDVSSSAPGFIVNDLVGVVSEDGSGNSSMTGFDTFVLAPNDEFVQGTNEATVYIAADPDTIVVTPGHAPITLSGADDFNIVLDFEGYGSALNGTGQLSGYTSTDGKGDTIINIPGDGAVTLAAYGFSPSLTNTEFNVGTPTCVCAGTMIATPDGEIAVEVLRAGDAVVIARDEQRSYAPVVWIGRRHIDCRHHANPNLVWPVRIAAGAFGTGRPHSDLWLSPDHALFLDGVLIPVKHLVDGKTIVQVPVDEVAYYHVELPRHDVLLAEGLPVESYLDTGDRANFDNGAETHLVPELRAADAVMLGWEARACAPLVVSRPRL
jgi:collagen type I alpha